MGTGTQSRARPNSTMARPLPFIKDLFQGCKILRPPYSIPQYENKMYLTSEQIRLARMNSRRYRVIFCTQKIQLQQLKAIVSKLIKHVPFLGDQIVFENNWVAFAEQQGETTFVTEEISVAESFADVCRMFAVSHIHNSCLFHITLRTLSVKELPSHSQALIIEISDVLSDSGTLDRIASMLQAILTNIPVAKLKIARPQTPLDYLTHDKCFAAKQLNSVWSASQRDFDNQNGSFIYVHQGDRPFWCSDAREIELAALSASVLLTAALNLSRKAKSAEINVLVEDVVDCAAGIASCSEISLAVHPMGEFQFVREFAIAVNQHTCLSDIQNQLLKARRFRVSWDTTFQQATQQHYAEICNTDDQLRSVSCIITTPDAFMIEFATSDQGKSVVCDYSVCQLGNSHICVERSSLSAALCDQLYKLWESIMCTESITDVQQAMQLLKTSEPASEPAK